METYYKKPIHDPPRFSIAVELRFLGIQTRWVTREEDGKRYLVPLVNQMLERRNERIADPDDIRRRFFKMKNDEKSAVEFLNSVGVWSVEEGNITVWSDGTLRNGRVVVGEKGSYLVGAFGHRFIQSGRALPWDLESLCRQRDRWRSTMHNNSVKLRKLFRPLLGGSLEEAYIFATNAKFGNTLPVHLEWQGKHARAVIQPITCEELLKALAWRDLVTAAKVKVCQNVNCAIEYTKGGSKFCTKECEHANTTRTYRTRLKERAAKPRSTMRVG
jgi:hypothetical protein